MKDLSPRFVAMVLLVGALCRRAPDRARRGGDVTFTRPLPLLWPLAYLTHSFLGRIDGRP